MNYFCLSLSLFLCTFLSAQTITVGVINNTLVEISPNSADIKPIVEIAGIENERLFKIAFDPDGCNYYGLRNGSNHPLLFKIDKDGNYSDVGFFSLNGVNLALVEALDYSEKDESLYISASLNGGTAQGDYWSGAILKVDKKTAECTLIADFETPTNLLDFDAFCFSDGQIYLHDGVPGSQNRSTIYQTAVENMDDFSTYSIYWQDDYIAIRDMIIDGDGNMRFPDINGGFYEIDGKNQELQYIGKTHNLSDYGGFEMVGITLANPEPCAVAPSISDLGNQSSSLSFYPNPIHAGEELNLFSPMEEGTTLRVIDVNGRLLKKIKYEEGLNKIKIPDFYQGLLFLQEVKNGELKEMHKILVLENRV